MSSASLRSQLAPRQSASTDIVAAMSANSRDEGIDSSSCSDSSQSSGSLVGVDSLSSKSSQIVESWDDVATDGDFFSSRTYTSKIDIKQAVLRYNEQLGRQFSVTVSSKQRYRAVCKVPDCCFLVHFAFFKQFKPPNAFIPHSCSVLSHSTKSRTSDRVVHASNLLQHELVRGLFATHGRDVTTRTIKKELEKIGLIASYKNRYNALKLLQVEFFGEDLEQYQFLPHYASLLSERGHRTAIEVLEDGTFSRMAIIFREGITAFEPFASRGLAVDGTHVKTMVGGVLLVACFRHGNGKIQIVAVGIVAIENDDNWGWFTSFLLAHLKREPAFFISDRDKGLKKALSRVCAHIPHFVCFRHLQENFNRKFKSRLLKDMAFRLARAQNTEQFEEIAQEMTVANAEALDWLLCVGKEKWSVAYSCCPRFGVISSNHVESINSALRGIRRLPILECLQAIEYRVGNMYYANTTAWVKWNFLTPDREKQVQKFVSNERSNMTASGNSSQTFVVSEIDTRTQRSHQFGVNLVSKACDCGFPSDMLAPCSHMLFVLLTEDRWAELDRYYDSTWKKECFATAYPALVASGVQPMTANARFRSTPCQAPQYIKRKGRPKKHKRAESQSATLALSQPAKKPKLCSKCKRPGHNAATCKGER